ncbi:Hypothetical_protein [Hexamita inflata]|uniref:Hypothetical_protein n=1 Tax=Hexamita inflata TaxID=28002 RepID=A0ABP1J584_9EUKA
MRLKLIYFICSRQNKQISSNAISSKLNNALKTLTQTARNTQISEPISIIYILFCNLKEVAIAKRFQLYIKFCRCSEITRLQVITCVEELYMINQKYQRKNYILLNGEVTVK